MSHPFGSRPEILRAPIGSARVEADSWDMPRGRYREKDIEVLPSHEAARRRAHLYVGDPTQPAALVQVTLEPACLALDEKTGGPARTMVVTLRDDDTAEIENDGPGLPLGSGPGHRETYLELIMTRLHACRDEKAVEANKRWCGVGVALLTALSEWTVVTVRRDGGLWSQRFEKGVAAGAIERQGDATTTGTSVRFRPDRTILRAPFDAALIAARLSELSRDVPCLTSRLLDLRAAAAQHR